MGCESKTFCPLPWMHLHLHTNGNVLPCCVSNQPVSNINSEAISEAWNNDSMKLIRKQMINNEEPSACNYCFEKEKLGLQSYRNWISEKYKHLIADSVAATYPDGTVENYKIKYIDFRFSNMCNFKCRSCNSEFSSSIAAEEEREFSMNHPVHLKAGGTKRAAYDEFTKHYDTLDSIYFAGGEPLMQWEHWQIIKDLTDSNRAANIELMYSTNGSLITSRNREILKYWTHFKSVCVCISIDAIGREAEYWRSGTDWQNIEKTIVELKEFKKTTKYFSFIIVSTISWPVFFSWIRLIKHCLEMKYIVAPEEFIYSTVDGPEDQSLRSLPDFKKQQILTALEEFRIYLNNYFGDDTGTKKLEYLRNYITSKNTPEELTKFTKQFELDRIRNEDFFRTFPEHEDMRSYLPEQSLLKKNINP